MADIKAVAFDAYGTIINFTEPDFIVTMAEICDQQGLDADAADLWRRFLRAAYLMRSENHDDPVYKRYDQTTTPSTSGTTRPGPISSRASSSASA